MKQETKPGNGNMKQEGIIKTNQSRAEKSLDGFAGLFVINVWFFLFFFFFLIGLLCFFFFLVVFFSSFCR